MAKPKKILHLIPDEKFSQFVFGLFNGLEGCENRFIINPVFEGHDFRFVHADEIAGVATQTYFDGKDALSDLEWCDCLIVHMLTRTGEKLIARAPDRVKVVWSAWGTDFYHLVPPPSGGLIEESTLTAIRNSGHGTLKFRLEYQTAPLWHGLRLMAARLRGSMRAIRRVDYFSAPIPDDYALLQSSFGGKLRAQYIQLNYASVAQTFAIGESLPSGDNVLLGNSANPTNNHFEVLRYLADGRLGVERKLIVPLSYGLSWYRDLVIRFGRDLLGDQFVPLVGHMPLSEYNGLLAGCSIAIMNHRRQQALGNIGTMLYQGSRVFLAGAGTCNAFFSARGAVVNRVDELEDKALCDFPALRTQEVARNRELLEEFWGDARVLNNARALVDLI